MSWENILKGSEEYRLYFLIDREVQSLIKEIKQSKSSQQFQENILQPIYEIMGSLHSARIYGVEKFAGVERKLKRHLRQHISPLNRNLADKIARSEYLR